MAITGSLGAKLYTTAAVVASTVDTEAEYMAQSWTEIGFVESVGDFGRMFETATFVELASGRTMKLKATYNDGQFQVVMGQDLSDAGQLILDTGAVTLSQSNYAYRLELNDAPSSVGGPTTFFFLGKPMSYMTQMGNASAVVKATSMIEIDSGVLAVDPAELYDQFPTGGSLSHYALFAGTDPQAVAPAISSNTLVLVAGNAGTGFAEDGSQAIGTTGYTLSAGALVIEAKIRTSNVGSVQTFFGLTDQIAALEIPIESASSADTITTNATNAVGFMFDTAMTTDRRWLVGVQDSVDQTAQDTNTTPVFDVYAVLRIELATNGDAVFYVNGAQVGTTMTTAVNDALPLYPTICIGSRTTTTRTMTVEYLYVRQG